MDLEEIAKKYALKNAVEYGGECNPGAVIGKIMSVTEETDPKEAQKIAGKVCKEINQLTVEEQKEKLEKYSFEEKSKKHDPIPDLKDAEEGNVVVRFAPNPNGPPHLGHSRGMIINGELRDKYSGKLILRFDDTDPRKKRPEPEAYEMYQEDFKWLGYKPDETLYSSKQFDKYIERAEQLIELEKAYVCSCDPEKGRKYRSEGKPCPHRSKDVKENLSDWQKMKKGGIEEGEAVLKIKTDLSHKNPAVRDFVAFRIIDNPDHPITGDKYRVWPMLDFAGAIEDHYTGTTHIVRGKDLRSSTKRQKYIYKYLDWEYPEVRYWGNVKITGLDIPVSTSSIKEMIEKDNLTGWDDVRAPTVRAFRKRGFQPEAFQKFWKEMGVSEKDNKASIETLEAKNREIIEEKANRYFFVKNPVKIQIKNAPEGLEPEIPLHPDHSERGYRKPTIPRKNGKLEVFIEEDDLEEGLTRLKGLCNIKIGENQEARYVEGDHKKAAEEDASIIHWVPAQSGEANVKMPDGTSLNGLIEPNDIDRDEVVQFERFGFVRHEDKNNFYYTHS